MSKKQNDQKPLVFTDDKGGKVVLTPAGAEIPSGATFSQPVMFSDSMGTFEVTPSFPVIEGKDGGTGVSAKLKNDTRDLFRIIVKDGYPGLVKCPDGTRYEVDKSTLQSSIAIPLQEFFGRHPDIAEQLKGHYVAQLMNGQGEWAKATVEDIMNVPPLLTPVCKNGQGHKR